MIEYAECLFKSKVLMTKKWIQIAKIKLIS
jgi:hypothetical protein